MSDYTPTVGELRQEYVEASGASMAQESYYAEQVAEFERGIARVKAEAWRDAAEFLESQKNVDDMMPALRTAAGVLRFRADRIEKEAGL